jgi:hypothetical protein
VDQEGKKERVVKTQIRWWTKVRVMRTLIKKGTKANSEDADEMAKKSRLVMTPVKWWTKMEL